MSFGGESGRKAMRGMMAAAEGGRGETGLGPKMTESVQRRWRLEHLHQHLLDGRRSRTHLRKWLIPASRAK